MELYLIKLEEAMKEWKKYDELMIALDDKYDAGEYEEQDDYLLNVYFTKKINAFEQAVGLLKVLCKCSDDVAKRMIILHGDKILAKFN